MNKWLALALTSFMGISLYADLAAAQSVEAIGTHECGPYDLRDTRPQSPAANLSSANLDIAESGYILSVAFDDERDLHEIPLTPELHLQSETRIPYTGEPMTVSPDGQFSITILGWSNVCTYQGMTEISPEAYASIFDSNEAEPDVPTEQMPEPMTLQSQQIWGCGAENRQRRYVVDQLDRTADSFDMAIYEKNRGDEGDYIGTVEISVVPEVSELSGREVSGLSGRGETFDSTLEVNAFGPTVVFSVEDSSTGRASGRCSVQWQMADSDTRRLVRQCLALAARREEGISEVSRFGCTTNPDSSLDASSDEQ